MPLPIIAGLKLSSALRSVALWALPYVLIFAAGAAAAIALEHNAPWGLAKQRNDALTDLGEARYAAGLWKKNRDGWEAYAKRLEADGGEQNAAATTDVSACSQAATTSASRAFDNGYAAGRVAGRKTCGAPNANPPAAAGLPGPGVVQPSGQTLAGDWANRAYVPAGSLPANR